MITLGITGSFADLLGSHLPRLPEWFYHDAAAALIVDGRTVAAVEEERLNRIKHTTKFPESAIKACIDIAGVRARDIDEIAFFFGEDYSDLELGYQYLENGSEQLRGARELMWSGIERGLGKVPDTEATFVKHHVAHGYGSFSDSGFGESLVMVIDANGESESVSIFLADSSGLRLLRTHPISVSLGHFYLSLLPFMGFGRFDEYKVMGLAPYGDRSTFRHDFDELVTLSPSGGFELSPQAVAEYFLAKGYLPRRKGEEVRQIDADLAAGLQDALERVVLHVLGHWREMTGVSRLCLAGGVAQNSSANGKVLASGLFDEVFVHPASHDSGAAIGAAQFRQAEAGCRVQRRLRNAFLGPSIGSRVDVWRALRRWAPFVEASEIPEGGQEDLVAARMVADGQVIGRAVGRSEFGPRALGNRSIIADPRPTENRERINSMVKKREGFRPFAPAVLESHADDIFELPSSRARFHFMSYVTNVRREWRGRLGAVTHVDGSARIQTVNRSSNPRLWNLISEFERLTGIPVVLNTSYNNFAEPIVQTIDDAIRCLVTTQLDAVVLPGHVVRRRADEDVEAGIIESDVVLHPAVELRSSHHPRTGSLRRDGWRVGLHVTGAPQVEVSPELFLTLASGGSRFSVKSDLLSVLADENLRSRLVSELMALWEHRLIDIVSSNVD